MLHAVAYTLIGLFVLTSVGNWACRLLFRQTGLASRFPEAGNGNDEGSAAPKPAQPEPAKPESTKPEPAKPEPTKPAQPAGWLIGWLERLILAIGIVAGSWEVLAAVIALKTVSRFQEMDDQAFAEYFLVGSLFSVLWAFAVTSLWMIYDRTLGIDLRADLLALL